MEKGPFGRRERKLMAKAGKPFLKRTGYAAFPRIMKAIARGDTSISAIQRRTNILRVVIVAVVTFARGTWITKKDGKLVQTELGRKDFGVKL